MRDVDLSAWDFMEAPFKRIHDELAELQTQYYQMKHITMTQELSQKSKEIWRYHAEHVVVFSRIRELVGHPGEVINKAHLYDRMMESADPTSARQTLPILVKYSRMMKDLLAEIQKIVPPSGTPMRTTRKQWPN